MIYVLVRFGKLLVSFYGYWSLWTSPSRTLHWCANWAIGMGILEKLSAHHLWMHNQFNMSEPENNHNAGIFASKLTNLHVPGKQLKEIFVHIGYIHLYNCTLRTCPTAWSQFLLKISHTLYSIYFTPNTRQYILTSIHSPLEGHPKTWICWSNNCPHCCNCYLHSSH